MPPMDPSPLVPHAVCWAGSPALIWTMVVTNFITFASYLTICLTLIFLVRRTGRVIAHDWRFFLVGFALFIVACGSTHLLEVITTWTPIFWVDASTNIVTAFLSAWVCISLIRRANSIAFGVNDYAARLAGAEHERSRMEASLLSARKLEDWSRMSAVVAHEIANPLETVQNLLYLIQGTDGVPAEVASLAQTAASEAARVLTITRNTLGFFRQSESPESIDIAEAAESVRFLLEPLQKDRSLRITIAAHGNTTAEAWPGEVRQVLLNLVRNACEATERHDAEVSISLTGEPDAVVITIADQGVGIPPTQRSRLFEFGRSTKGDKGNGMGLWTVKHIVERHGGTIAVQSTPGAGTTFTLHWPRTMMPATQPTPDQPTALLTR